MRKVSILIKEKERRKEEVRAQADGEMRLYRILLELVPTHPQYRDLGKEEKGHIREVS